MPLKERRTIVKKDEKDAGSRRWNAPIVSASCESGYFFLNLRSHASSWDRGNFINLSSPSSFTMSSSADESG